MLSLAFVFFFLWSCFNSHLALPLSSSRSSTKQGAWGVFTHFPSPLSYTLITGLELLDNAESVTFLFFFLFSGYFTCESDSSPVSSCTYTWWPFHLINYFYPLKKITLWHLDSRETIMKLNVEDETLIFQLVIFLHGNTG